MENSREDLGPLPGPDINADARTYWAAAAEERLVVQCCDECGIYRFYPRPLCPDCASDQATWTEVSGQGSVHTFTIVHRAPNKEFQAITPYVIALIDLDEGPRMMANILMCFAALFWGATFIAQKTGMETIGPMGFTFGRYVIGTLALLPCCIRRSNSLRMHRA